MLVCEAKFDFPPAWMLALQNSCAAVGLLNGHSRTIRPRDLLHNVGSDFVTISRSETIARRKESAAVIKQIAQIMKRALESTTDELNASGKQPRATVEEVRQMARQLAVDDIRRLERESVTKLAKLNLQWIKAASAHFALGWTASVDLKVRQIERLQYIKSLDGVIVD